MSEEDALACLDAIQIVSEPTSAEGHKLGWRWAGARPWHWRSGVSFEVTLPARLVVNGKTHNGQIEATGLAADCRLETHNGPVHLESAQGDVYVETHNGRIEATTGGSHVDVRTHNGGVRMTSSAAEHVDVETHNGGITADLSACATPGGRLVTHNGKLQVRFGDETSVRIVCRTQNGGISSDVDWRVSEMTRRRAAGVLGQGGGELKLETHNGSIRLVGAID